MADILDRIPVDDEMTIFKTQIEPIKLNACIDNILMRLDRLETSMAKPVKRGKWVKHINHRYDYDREQGDILAGVSYTCSLCSFHGYDNWHYCPNCGVQMSTE